MRSLLAHIYRVIIEAREGGLPRATSTVESVRKLLCAAVFLPLVFIDLTTPWCSRVVATDAAPGGWGEAYTEVSLPTLHSWASLACQRGDYASPLEEGLLDAPDESVSKMSKAHLPLSQYGWSEVPRPGWTSHIALAEYGAYCWSLERRRLRVGELGTRCLMLGDNQTQVGAHGKGRSSSRALNSYCRRDCALQVAEDVVALELSLPSGKSPS